MSKEKLIAIWKQNNVWILGALVGISTFLWIYGAHVLNVTYTDWLLGGGDLTQNYLGWCFFRNSDWFFPFGLMDTISYPNRVSVIFTDSVPLLAVWFKLFRGFLPEEFQYFGIWGLLCFGAQGAFGALLIHHYVKKKAEAVVGSLLFVITPVMLAQMTVNMALGGQWLILASLYLGIHRKEITLKREALLWGIVGLLAAGIQLYFIPICGFILLSFLLSDVLRRTRYREDLAGLGAYLCTSVGAVALLGGFDHQHIADATALGQSAFNLNGLFNPQGWSQMISSLPVYGANAENGLAFPGTGIILTLVTGAVAWLLRIAYRIRIKKEKKLFSFRWKKKENGIAFLILILLCVFAALSPDIAYGSSVVVELSLPEWLLGLWGRVANCGRFIWPVVYLVILGSVVWMEKEMPWQAMAAVLLVLYSGIQISDGKWQLMQRQVQFSTDYVYESPLQDEQWELWAQEGEKKHLVFVSYMVDDEEQIYELSAYAAENGMTVNDFCCACQTIRSLAAVDLLDALAEPREDTLYIYSSEDGELCIDSRMEYLELDGVIVGNVRSSSKAPEDGA